MCAGSKRDPFVPSIRLDSGEGSWTNKCTYLRSVTGMGVMKARAGVARARKEMVRMMESG